jgi:hypothetical protein
MNGTSAEIRSAGDGSWAVVPVEEWAPAVGLSFALASPSGIKDEAGSPDEKDVG